MPSLSGAPVVIVTYLIAAIHGGRLLSASIWVFSMKIVSLRIQLFDRTVRSSIAAFPTLLKSGCVLVASGVLVQVLSCVSSIRSMVDWATELLGNGLPSKGQL